jgi:hypothetical protein
VSRLIAGSEIVACYPVATAPGTDLTLKIVAEVGRSSIRSYHEIDQIFVEVAYVQVSANWDAA